ncbi:hypothetical protein EVAR_44007_1 [Eumeta japonica]|uniref:Uncharacterized protein n=1 Tax=Eumeta variegata TaxID=151549 RepID=A0A4C1XCG2_EUMVA|nr:hypothetical protein EVAR_44007_1 [Eumeta japonica]
MVAVFIITAAHSRDTWRVCSSTRIALLRLVYTEIYLHSPTLLPQQRNLGPVPACGLQRYVSGSHMSLLQAPSPGGAIGAQAQGVDSGGRKNGQTRQDYYFFNLLLINSRCAPSARFQNIRTYMPVSSKTTKESISSKSRRDKKNIVFFAIEELESSYDTLEKNMLEWIEQHFSVKLSYSDLQEVKRLGKKGDRPRPVVVTFLTLGIKIKIFKQKRALRDTNYYMKEDCPKHVLEKRNQLQEQLKAKREKGNTAFLKYDKLVVLKQTSKRKFSPSPIKPTENTPKERNTNK